MPAASLAAQPACAHYMKSSRSAVPRPWQQRWSVEGSLHSGSPAQTTRSRLLRKLRIACAHARRPEQIFVTQSRSTAIGRRSQPTGFHGESLQVAPNLAKTALPGSEGWSPVLWAAPGSVALEATHSMHGLFRQCVSGACACLGTTATEVPAIARMHPAPSSALVSALDRPSGNQPEIAASTWRCSVA